MGSNLSFSYSKMGMYKECPQKYKFRYILKIPEKPKYYFAFGTALHKVMEFMYSAGKPPFPTLEKALKFFKTDWDSTSFEDKGYASAIKEQDGYLEGVRIIKAYYEKHLNDNFAPLATEFRTTVNIDGLSVISILDRVDYLGDGKVGIVDYKTGKTLTLAPDQLMMYQKLMDGNPQLQALVKAKDPDAKEIKISNMFFYHLPSLKEQAFEPAPKEEIDIFWQGVLKVAADIMAGKFAPDPGETKCRFCDYKPMCPVWNLDSSAEGSCGDLLTPECVPAATTQEELAHKIDAYGKAVAEAENLKVEIIKIMQDNGFTRHFGSEYFAELEKTEIIDFKDQQKTIELLKKFNLLPKVLVPTLSSIKKLLESDIKPEQKRALEELSSKAETIKLNCKKTED